MVINEWPGLHVVMYRCMWSCACACGHVHVVIAQLTGSAGRCSDHGESVEAGGYGPKRKSDGQEKYFKYFKCYVKTFFLNFPISNPLI